MAFFNKRDDIDFEEEEYIPEHVAPGEEDVTERRFQSWGSVLSTSFKNITLFIVVIITMLAVLYSALSATLMFYSPISDNNGEREWVVRNQWPSNTPPVGEDKVVISLTKSAPEDFMERVTLGWVGIENPTLVKVESTSYAAVEINKNAEATPIVISSQKPAGEPGNFVSSPSFPYEEGEKLYHELDDQLLVSCAVDVCWKDATGTPTIKKGDYFIIYLSQIYGMQR